MANLHQDFGCPVQPCHVGARETPHFRSELEQSNGATSGVWFRCAGLVALLVLAGTRVIRTVPLNSATLTWDPERPPNSWATMVHRAERFHVVGVCAAVMAFACFLAALGNSALP